MKTRKTRSASGAGGIRQRSDGRFEARYSVLLDGRQERRSIFGATSAEVRQKLRAALTNRDHGLVAKVSARETVSTAGVARRWASTESRKATCCSVFG